MADLRVASKEPHSVLLSYCPAVEEHDAWRTSGLLRVQGGKDILDIVKD